MSIFRPKRRREYRDVYKSLPETGRLPVMNKGYDRIPTLVVPVASRATDQHSDYKDWKKGTSHLLQFRQFEGGGMCLPYLGFLFKGYGPDAVFGLKASETDHFVPGWKGFGARQLILPVTSRFGFGQRLGERRSKLSSRMVVGLVASEEKTFVEVETAVQEAESLGESIETKEAC